MSEIYEVLALKYATNDRPASHNFIGGDEHDRSMPIDYFIWVIRNEKRTVVVDTGFNPVSGAHRARKLTTPVNVALSAVGIHGADIEHVITTHMHYDHAGNNDMFPNACFYMQESEMHYATGSCMCHRLLNHPYEADDVAGMVKRVYAGKVSFCLGDRELFPGLSVHHVGGHSRGLQCVRVETQRGPVVLASDASHLYAHMNSGRVFPTCDSVADTVLGYGRLFELGGDASRIVPGHDPEVMRRYPALSPQTSGMVVKLDVDEATG
ncbi:N-acyl homoserine lactonase family protein [Shinella pollutisoli]|uniref:N-acyl homoserine lactonase family protein n=1 Tax=Shinella pollutisoli TaxID=2250594 RepID=A0ABV7DLF9_9HYPH|nr:N-acyl homoserine lactonase family protein [Shinella pollutisoli]